MARSKFLEMLEKDIECIYSKATKKGNDTSYAFERLLGVEHSLIWSYEVEPWFNMKRPMGEFCEEVCNKRLKVFDKNGKVASNLFGENIYADRINNTASKLYQFNLKDAEKIIKRYPSTEILKSKSGLNEILFRYEDSQKYQIRISEKGDIAFVRQGIDFKDQNVSREVLEEGLKQFLASHK